MHRSLARCSSKLHKAAQVGFTKETIAAYETGRPSYNVHLVRAMLAMMGVSSVEPVARIVELGAGTGKFTARAVEEAVGPMEYIALEPSLMREHIPEVAPGVEVREGVAGDMGFLEDNWASGLVAAQSLHWFSGDRRALEEMHRVLSPTGAFTAIWNTRDRSLPHQKALEEFIDQGYPADVPRQVYGTWRSDLEQSGLFDPIPIEDISSRIALNPRNTGVQAVEPGHLSIPYTQECTVEQIVAKVLSISVFSALSPAKQDETRQQVLDIVYSHFPNSPSSPTDTVTLTYSTDAWFFSPNK